MARWCRNAVEFFDAQHDFASSLAVVRGAYEKQPTDRTLRVSLADRLQKAGKAGEGETLLREATQADDPRVAAQAWTDVARYRHGMGEHAAAAEAWERAIGLMREFGEPDPQVLFQFADALVISGQAERAAKIADEISVPAQQHLIRGRIEQVRGQHGKALAEFDEAAKLWPNNAFARYYTALSAELRESSTAVGNIAMRSASLPGDGCAHASRAHPDRAGQFAAAYQILFFDADKSPLEPEGGCSSCS
jgi:tetratricopeptide (TPR) repeat protein